MRKNLKTMISVIVTTITITALSVTTAFAGEWRQDQVGWWYQNDNGSYPKSEWLNHNGQWYYFNGSGYMHAGWFYDGQNWYYMADNGAMQANGITPDGCAVTANGAWVTMPDLEAVSNGKGEITDLVDYFDSVPSKKFDQVVENYESIMETNDVKIYSNSFNPIMDQFHAIDFSEGKKSQSATIRYYATADDIVRIYFIYYGIVMRDAVANQDYAGAERAYEELQKSVTQYNRDIEAFYKRVE